MRYGMVINTGRCFGCQTCVVGCKVNNQIADDNYWSRMESGDGMLLYQASGSFPNCNLSFRPLLCNHCDNPACVENCPTGAMQKDPDTGVVLSDGEVCIGCGTCVASCPYEMPILDTAASLSTKCTFCSGRVADGLEPYCVESCPGRARTFGDLDDDQSEVSKLIKEKNAKPTHEEYGTGANVYYF